jgi:UDP-N-acetylmuramate: L-alanyl-gamma-D-glutamyl-meso-diaminopimelate ligase
MHNLAIALHQKGYQITGSDDTIFEPSKSRLERHGLLPTEFGWFPEKITSDLDAIILGMHAKKDNEELLKAQELGMKIYSYPEFLYEQSKNKTRVVIGGSHAKTTITSMILHVLHYHDKEVDYMVGAQLEGFDTMVHLTEENDFIVLEGDEYLSSPIDRRPKFHLYHPNIALVSGIAWDHINVFPTFDTYVDQFRVFMNSIVNGGALVYNEEDPEVKKLSELTENPIRKFQYTTPEYSVEDGETLLNTPEGEMPIEIFGAHNLNNLAGAKWICQHMGIDEDDFYEAIASFKGASKRLEKIAESDNAVAYKDFAHSPSKLKATTAAVKTQFKNKELVACMELHTFSSLSTEFLSHYAGAMDTADIAIVYFNPHTIEHKKLPPISIDDVKKGFAKEDLLVFTESKKLQNYLLDIDYSNKNLLIMTSGNLDGVDLKEFGGEICKI